MISMPELLDVIDENDNVIGREERDICLEKKLLHRGVHIFIFNSEGELLLQKRSMQKKTYPGAWTSSCSGHVSAGQTYEEAAVRELEEELGIKVGEKDLRVIIKFLDPNPVDTELCMLYEISHEGPFDFGREEVSEVKFLPVKEIQEELKNFSENYTPDFALAFSKFLSSDYK